MPDQDDERLEREDDREDSQTDENEDEFEAVTRRHEEFLNRERHR